MKAVVVFHGDCDGVIAAGLYIRRFLRDYYPENIILRFTQPWRVVHDIESTVRYGRDIDELVIVDLAISTEMVKLLRKLIDEIRINIVLIDHHASSMKMLEQINELSRVRVYWDSVQSTPQVLTKAIKNLNSYEEFLVRIANVCEGGEDEDQELQSIADKIKLVLALDPTDSKMFYDTVKSIVEGIEFWNDKEFEKRFHRAKWLLTMLIKTIERRARNICGWDIVSFTAAESLIYAGLFGIAASEYMKRHRKPLVIIRSESGKKIVITVRSSEGLALELCRAISERISDAFYGGHREAASLTIYGNTDLNTIKNAVEETIKGAVCRVETQSSLDVYEGVYNDM